MVVTLNFLIAIVSFRKFNRYYASRVFSMYLVVALQLRTAASELCWLRLNSRQTCWKPLAIQLPNLNIDVWLRTCHGKERHPCMSHVFHVDGSTVLNSHSGSSRCISSICTRDIHSNCCPCFPYQDRQNHYSYSIETTNIHSAVPSDLASRINCAPRHEPITLTHTETTTNNKHKV